MVERKQMRQKTALEQESEKEPKCLYDPARVEHCVNFEWPPKEEVCEKCLTNSILDDLENRLPSAVLRWFLAYKSFKSFQLSKTEGDKNV